MAKVGRPREYANRAQKQQAYRVRRDELDSRARRALHREQELKAAIIAASCRGVVPFSICNEIRFGDEIDNLIEWLKGQSTLITEL
jgi:hypothetical protein